MRALALTELARDRGVHGQVHDRLMRAYWEEARNIGDPKELRVLADEAGLDEAEVVEAIEGSTYRERVRSSTAEALGMGITAVPAFVLDRRLLVLGAQPQAIFEQAVGRLRNGQREGL
jgi:predicted DsbA family dithiol-disulfide isomerase